MHMLTNLMISVSVDVADVWSYTNAPAPLDLVEGREEGEMKDIRIIARKNL